MFSACLPSAQARTYLRSARPRTNSGFCSRGSSFAPTDGLAPPPPPSPSPSAAAGASGFGAATSTISRAAMTCMASAESFSSASRDHDSRRWERCFLLGVASVGTSSTHRAPRLAAARPPPPGPPAGPPPGPASGPPPPSRAAPASGVGPVANTLPSVAPRRADCGVGTISASLMLCASRYAETLALNMSRRRTQPPCGVPAVSSGLAEPVDRPVHAGS